MFYDNVTLDQVNSTKALLKLLRFLRICGVLEVVVTSNSKKYPSQKGWTYSMKAGKYFPDVHRLDMEIAEEALQALVEESEDLGLYDDWS